MMRGKTRSHRGDLLHRKGHCSGACQTVIMACRDQQGAETASWEIRREAGQNQGEIVIKHLDLASLRSARFLRGDNKGNWPVCLFCSPYEESRIDVLINNAGVFQRPYTRIDEGFQMQFRVNHLGHFLLLDLVKKFAPSRIVVVSSKLYKYGEINVEVLNSEQTYNKASAYSRSKLTNLLFTLVLAQEPGEVGVTVNAVTPGMVRTNLGRLVHIPSGQASVPPGVLGLFKKPPGRLSDPLFTWPALRRWRGSGGGASPTEIKRCLFPNATDEQAARKLDWNVSNPST